MTYLSKNFLLNKNKISDQNVFSILDDMKSKKINFGDIYFQSKFSESWILENNIIKNYMYDVDNGIGIRAVQGKSTFFSYINSINLINLQNLSKVVFNLIDDKSFFYKKSIKRRENDSKYSIYIKKNPIKTIDNEKKIYLLKKINDIAKKEDPRVIKVNVSLNIEYEEILISSTDNLKLIEDSRPLVHLSISIISEQNNYREKGYSGGGGRYGINYFFEKNEFNEVYFECWTKEAVRISIIALSAKESPAGSFPVVLGPGWPGIIFHESVGHGLESDFIRKKSSLFTDKLGKKVASNLCTLIDDGTLKNRRGSINFDDEGVPSQKNVLIKKGILKNFLQDKLNSYLMNLSCTGNGRRESYAHVPMPRMTNTYLMPGLSEHDEIISSINYGIYAKNFSGGQVDITSGNFVFFASESYIIKKGKILYPIKGAMFMGNGLNTLNKISMVGNNLCLDNGMGLCGKNGQNIPVGVGQPTIKVDKLVVGGKI